MSTLALICLTGIFESVIYWWRIRAASVRSSWNTLLATLATCASRVVFVAAGVSAVMKDHNLLIVILVYSVPAALCTAMIHEWAERRKETKP